MSIEKPLSPLPEDDIRKQQIEAVIASAGDVSENGDGSIDVDFGDIDDPSVEEPDFDANLADFMDEKDLQTLSTDLVGDYMADETSRDDWKQVYIKGLDLLGLKFEDRTTPWDGACGVFHPLLTDSVIRFQAQTIQEIFPASGPAKASVTGKITIEKTKISARVTEYINHVSTKVMQEYRTETEKLLFSLAIAGSAFRKIYYDPNLGRECSMFIPAEDFVVSYGTSDLSTCPRATHIMKKTRNDIRKMQVNGFYRDVELGDPSPEYSDIKEKQNQLSGDSPTLDNDSRDTLLEMLVDVDLPGFEHTDAEGNPTGIQQPYVVTIDYASGTVLSIRRNWREEDQFFNKREHFVHYLYLPGFGFYGFGLAHIIGGLTKSATSLLRQLVDAGTLANLPGGLKTRGLKIKGDDSPIQPGEYRDVDVMSGTIKDNIAFLPYKEPSAVLYQLLGDLVAEGRRFAAAADLKASEMNNEAPVGTTLAILEKEMKVISAVQARIHAAMSKEITLLVGLIKDYGPEQYPYEIDDEEATLKGDFAASIQITPVSDPNSGTMAQRIVTYQAAIQLMGTAPELYDKKLLHRQMLEVINLPNADKIVPTEDDMTPKDPVTETADILAGKPVKAFLYQDHEAHIQAHMSAAENPKIIELMQQHPNAKGIMAAGAAHIAEHLGYAYRRKIEEELGMPLPHPNEKLPEDIELRISRLVAPAAAQLTGKAQQEKQAQENAAKQEDPIIQMQQKELEIEEKKAEAKAQEAMAKIQAQLKRDQEQIALKRAELAQRGEIARGQIAAKVAGDRLRAASEADRMTVQQGQEAVRMGIDVGKTALQTKVQMAQIKSNEKSQGDNGNDNE